MSIRSLETVGLWGHAPRRSWSVEAGAIFAALALHAGVLLLRSETPPVPAVALHPLAALLIDAQPEPEPIVEAEAEVPVDLEPPSARDPAPVTRSVRAAAPTNNAPSAAIAGDNTPDEPAEIATAGSSDWEMLSGGGNALGRGGVARPGGLAASGRATALAPRDFSREAQAPALQPFVNANFPSIARMYKVDGDVTVSALIGTEGQASDLRVESVEPGGRGFGESCSRSVLQGPRWKPKLNRDGRPVATRVTYRCKFRLPEDAKVSPSAATPATGGNRVWTRSAE